MADLLEIPMTAEETSFKIRVILEGIQLILRIDWIERELRWMLSIYNAQETPLLLGLPMNINTELIERFEIDGLPPGKLLFYDSTGGSIEAGRDDLGDRAKLIYQTSV